MIIRMYPISGLKGQKPFLCYNAFALAGRWLHTNFTQGVALGYGLVAFQAVFTELAEDK